MRSFLLLTLALLPGLVAAQPPGRSVIPDGTLRPDVVVPGPRGAPPNRGFVPRVPMEVQRAPRVTSIGGHLIQDAQGSPAFQYFVLTPLEISLTGLGAAGEVRMRVESRLRGGDQRARCHFSTEDGQQTGPAVIAPDGTATFRISGVFQPVSLADVTAPGICRLELVVERRQVNLRYRVEARIPLPEIPVAPHETLEIHDTARLRGFLRPVPSPECEADDRDGKFGQRITARTSGGGGCRTDFLDPRDKRPGMFNSPTLNALGEGVILRRLSWRLEGDRQACELCDNPLTPCRFGGGSFSLAAEAAFYLRWVYAPLRNQEIGNMDGGWFSVFGGPPELGRGRVVRVNTHGYYHDTLWLDFFTTMFGSGDSQEGNDVIGIADGRWRSWMRPFGVRLQCSPWVPPPVEVARGLGRMLRGGDVRPAQPPSLRLVLESLTFLRPAGRAVPGE